MTQGAAFSKLAAKTCVLALALLIDTSSSLEAAELVMIDFRACAFCAKFNREVGKDYSETEAGQIAPLRRVSPRKKWPADLAAVTPARFTPVFILVEDGQEIGRFAGYSNSQSFWLQLSPLIAKLDTTPSPLPEWLAEGRSGLF